MCPNCGKVPVKCILCMEAGAFDSGGSNAEIHKGKCIYEPCTNCEKEFRDKFKKWSDKKRIKKLYKRRFNGKK